MQGISSDPEVEDAIIWWKDSSDFTVKNSLHRMTELRQDNVGPDTETRRTLDCLWSCKLPNKVQICGWKLLINMLPMKADLEKFTYQSNAVNEERKRNKYVILNPEIGTPILKDLNNNAIY